MEATKETWKPVPGWEGIYEASDRGRVRRLWTTRSPGVLKPWLTYSKGAGGAWVAKYPRVELYRPGDERASNGRLKTVEKKRIYLHKLVWETFNGPVPAGMELNHKNFDKQDASLGNLELMTPQQNKAHARQRVLFFLGEANIAKMRELAPTTPRAVLAEQFDVSLETVARVCSDIPAAGNKILTPDARAKLRAEMLARTVRTAATAAAIAKRYGVSMITAYAASRPGRICKPHSAPGQRMAA